MNRFAQTLLPKIWSSLGDRSFFASSFRRTKSLLKLPYHRSGSSILSSWSRRRLPALILSSFCLAAALSNKDAEKTADETQTVENVTVSKDDIDTVNLFNEICKIVEETKDAVVQVVCHGEEWTNSGTGFLFGQMGFGITHANVVKESLIVDVCLQDGRKFKAVVLALCRQADLALFQILAREETLKGLPILELASVPGCVKKGEIILHLGYPTGIGFTVPKGVITSDVFSLLNMNKYYVLVNVTAQEGCCGGPVLNLRGEVIGVLCFGANEPILLMIPLSEFYNLEDWTESWQIFS